MEPAGPLVPAPARRTTWRLLGFFAGTAVAAAVAWIIVGTGLWGAGMYPAELRSALPVQSRDGQLRVVQREGSGFVVGAPIPGTLASIAHGGNAPLAVSRDDVGRYLLVENGIIRAYADGPIGAASRAPDGTAYAYAVQVEDRPADARATPTGGPVPQLALANPAHWEVRLAQVKSATSTPLARGLAPLFLDESHLFFLAASGGYVYDLTNGTASLVIPGPFASVITPVIQSPDRSLLAITNAADKRTAVYRVTGSAFTLLLAAETPLLHPALSDSALYDVRGTADGAEVWRYPLDGNRPRRVYTFPAPLAIARIIF